MVCCLLDWLYLLGIVLAVLVVKVVIGFGGIWWFGWFGCFTLLFVGIDSGWFGLPLVLWFD